MRLTAATGDLSNCGSPVLILQRRLTFGNSLQQYVSMLPAMLCGSSWGVSVLRQRQRNAVYVEVPAFLSFPYLA